MDVFSNVGARGETGDRARSVPGQLCCWTLFLLYALSQQSAGARARRGCRCAQGEPGGPGIGAHLAAQGRIERFGDDTIRMRGTAQGGGRARGIRGRARVAAGVAAKMRSWWQAARIQSVRGEPRVRRPKPADISDTDSLTFFVKRGCDSITAALSAQHVLARAAGRSHRSSACTYKT